MTDTRTDPNTCLIWMFYQMVERCIPFLLLDKGKELCRVAHISYNIFCVSFGFDGSIITGALLTCNCRVTFPERSLIFLLSLFVVLLYSMRYQFRLSILFSPLSFNHKFHFYTILRYVTVSLFHLLFGNLFILFFHCSFLQLSLLGK